MSEMSFLIDLALRYGHLRDAARAVVQATGHQQTCHLVTTPCCTCGQVDELKLARAELVRLLRQE